MSNTDYKKLYEEALERAKRWADGTLQPERPTPQGVCEAIFPELREDEELNLLKQIQNYHEKYLAGLYITFSMYKRIARYFYFLGKKQK